MRRNTVGPLALLVAASASAVAASDITGNNVALNGADSLFNVTQDVLSMCPGAYGRNIQHLGGGSSVAVTQMIHSNQRIAPLGRAIKDTEYCSVGTQVGVPVSSPANTEALLLGVDGISLLANTATTCSSTTANGVGRSFPVPGFANYVPANSIEVLTLLYFGLHNGTGGSTVGAYDCNSPQRRALVANWQNLFGSDCASGASVCPNGLTHAFRPADVSGAGDAFIGIVGLTSRVLGTFATDPASAPQTNPFCNTHDANNGTSSFLDEGTPQSLTPNFRHYWSAGDMQDEDPIRVNANPNTATSTTGDTVARGGQVPVHHFAGTLGLVLPIFPPDAPGITVADAYPTANCSTFCDLVPVIKGSLLPPGYTCPDDTEPTLGGCYLPIIKQSNPDPRCIATNSTVCFGSQFGAFDGRAYNLVTVVLATQVPPSYRAPDAMYQFALDANHRIMSGSFYRLHMRKPSPNAAPDAGLGQTGICQQPDATSQIGCLVDADRCSVGLAGRGAAANFPGLGQPPIPAASPLKALAISAPDVPLTPPFTPGGDSDLALRNLLAAPGTQPFYPLARRLYLATIYGFGDAQLLATNPPNPDLTSGERELVKCFNAPSISTVAVSGSRYVPHVTASGNVECLDYPEEGAAFVPPVNTQGPGNVALPGCSMGYPAHNACTDPVTAP
jgi:hypothetical protein